MAEARGGWRRYGIYVLAGGAFHDRASAWLGWDSVAGAERAHPALDDLPGRPEDLTATPRKYGFHGTIKPPFRLADGRDEADLRQAFAAFCAAHAPVSVPRLEVRRLGGFVAVVPATPCAALADLAAAVVEALDGFRAPADEAELARRRKAGLSARQEALLSRWGYPYVMDEFRYHMTLTGKLPRDTACQVRAALAAHFAPVLPEPFTVGDLCLLGEAGTGRFHMLHRYTLTG